MSVFMPQSHATPLVSVLIPAYNHAPYVRTAVESVLGQTYGNLELIVIDDASTDATWAELRSFRDARLRLSRHAQNLGAYATLNELRGLARGEFIAILNSDDVYYPERIEKAVSCLRCNPEWGACFSRFDFIDEAGGVVKDADSLALGFPDAAKALGPAAAALERNELQVLSLLSRNYLHTTSNLFARRGTLDRVGLFRDFRYVHDYDFFLRLSHRFSIGVIPQGLLGYRFHATNTLAENAAASVAETAAMLAEFLLTHELKATRHDGPTFLAVLGYLLENLGTYGADRLVLLLALAETRDGRKPDAEGPLFRDCSSDEGIRKQVASLLARERAAKDLDWQKRQTTQWWEEAQQRGNRLVRMKARQGRVGKKLWETRQQLEASRQALYETQGALQHSEEQLAWWRDKYRHTLTARIKSVARRLIDATKNPLRKGKQ